MSNPDFNISVDLSSLGVNDQLSPQVVKAIGASLQTSLALIKDKWQISIQNKLHSTRPLYLQGLGFDSIVYPYDSPFSGAVVLKGKLPNMLEKGFPSFNIKLGFSKSGRIKKKKNGGWYLTIPFRHSTPGAHMYGQPMTRDVYRVAKKLNPYQSGLGNTRLNWPGAGETSWTGYQWKTNKYSGMTRIVKSYQKATQSQYMTFRRASDKSDPRSWWHPGYQGAKIAESLLPYARKTFVDVLTSNLNNGN